MGRDEEARAVFETALTLDPENLIALKHLGDIARQAGDFEGSRSWYQRVLEADPRNDEIMQILEAMGGVDGGSGIAAVSDVVSDMGVPSLSHSSPDEPSMDASAGAGDHLVDHAEPASASQSFDSEIEPLVLEQSVDADLPVAEPEVVEVVETIASSHIEAAPEEQSHELLDLDDFSLGSSDAPADASVEPEPEPVAAAGSLDFVALGDEPATEQPAQPAQPAPDEAPEPAVELATDMILGLPDDSSEPPPLPEEAALSEIQLESTPASGVDLTAAIDQLEGLETFSMDVAPEPPSASTDEVEAPPAASPDTFATETMAELYAQQGHLESALEIYGQLLERSPDDAELRRRADDVERQLRGAPAAVESESTDEALVASAASEMIATGDVSEAAPPVVAGPTIREFFREILEDGRADEMVARNGLDDTVESAVAAIGAPEGSIDMLFSDSPTADDDLSAAMSLAEAFGSESEGDDSALRGTPAHPAADELSLDHVFRSATPAKGAAAGGFSLDQFFSGNAANPETSETSAEGTSPRSNDDIAQFNAWLNGLKKS
ncbi:MAG TPA: tetratricopeptide repeat protein, partial [Gemmatimonadaceae bacterium]